jgi:hypothetical protein
MHRIVVALLAGSPLAAATQDASAVQGGPPDAPIAGEAARTAAASDGVYLGVGFGPAVLTSGAGGDGPGSAFRIRVGAARSARVAFGFEGGLAVNDNAQLGTYDVGVTFFPWERFFYVRGAVGLTTLALPDDPAERGANILLGLGVALGSAHGANLTVNVDAQYHRTSAVGHGLVDHGASSASAWLGFEWR